MNDIWMEEKMDFIDMNRGYKTWTKKKIGIRLIDTWTWKWNYHRESKSLQMLILVLFLPCGDTSIHLDHLLVIICILSMIAFFDIDHEH